MTEHTSPLPTAVEVLQAVAPQGTVPSADTAFTDAIAYLEAKGHSAEIAELVGTQVRKFCQDRGIWSLVDGRRCLKLPQTLRAD